LYWFSSRQKIRTTRVAQVEDRYAVADAIAAGPFERGYLIRLAGAGAKRHEAAG
jgi:hypothetical protein